MSVGVERFDRQHQRLLRLLQLFEDTVAAGQDRRTVARVLRDLVQYSGTHFGAEEGAMRATAFPGFESHRQEHDLFVKKINEFQRAFERGEADVTREVLDFLLAWVASHIEQTDKDYAGHFAVNKVA